MRRRPAKPKLTDRQKYARALDAQRLRREEASSAPIPARITMALDFAGLDGPEVDRALGVEEPTVDLWESGEIVPTREQVERLALLTGFAPRWFYRPPTFAGPLMVCGAGGCELIDNRPPEPVADVRPLHPDTLW